MYVKPNKLLLTSILFYCFVYARAATITISGPTQVCPTLTYTYTASASNALGSKKGDFEWTFWRGNVLLGVIGGIGECPTSPNNASSSTVTFNWGYDLGDVKIRVRFKGNNDPLCYVSGPDVKWLNVKVRVLSPGKISGLTFCSPNETRLVTVVPIPTVNDASTCFYHYKYEWIVPNGWTILPKSGNYTNIEGGIRTGADSVWITAPSTLQSGYSGNYMVTVRTEDQWPWPAQSSEQVWVGTPSFAQPIAGPTNVLLNGSANYSAQNVVGNIQDLWWNIEPTWHLYPGTDDGFFTTVIVTDLTPNEITASAANACGTSNSSLMVFPSHTCEYSVNVKSNPGNSNQIVVDIIPPPGECDGFDSNLVSNPFILKLSDESGQILQSSNLFKEKNNRLTSGYIKPGVYYLSVERNKQKVMKRVVIK